MKAKTNRHISTHKSRGVYKSSKYLLRSGLWSSLLRHYERIQKILETGYPLGRANIQLEFPLTPQFQNNGSKFLSGMLWARGIPCASCALLGRCWSSSLEEERSCSLPDVWLLSPLKLCYQRKATEHDTHHLSHVDQSGQHTASSTSAVPPVHITDSIANPILAPKTHRLIFQLQLPHGVFFSIIPGQTVRPKTPFRLLL